MRTPRSRPRSSATTSASRTRRSSASRPSWRPIRTTSTRSSALAGAQRSAKQFKEAAATYDKAIAAIGIPTRDNWTLFYFRGICYERAKEWPKAEDDFQKALEL